MNIILEKANTNNAEEIFNMQIKSFEILLKKYKDYETNPGNENIERTIQRLNQDFRDFYIIKQNKKSVGAFSVRRLENGSICKIGPIFVLPQYQNKGIAQEAFKIIESKYKPEKGWILDTILEEAGNCHLYEKIGYTRTGKIEKINERMNIVYYEKIVG
jgi:N-acetylglutamate synthase-like GNAT family acetyltransferase